MKTPWGKMWTLIHTKNFWLKIIHVRMGHRTSLQYHNFRDEWHISIRGIKFVPSGTVHRMRSGFYLELAYGPNIRESDIVRVADDYNRSN